MTNTSGIFIHSQVALPKEYSNFLKEGNSILVRILKQNSPNSYLASFVGGRFPIKSNIPLQVGSRFMAKVSFKNGVLNLVKTNDISVEKNQNQNQNVVQRFTNLSPEVSNILMSLGLPVDSVSKMLLQTMIMSGAKINTQKMNKARNAAMKFPGREEEASEAALILIDKGIEPSEENIQDVLTGFSIESGKTSTELANSQLYDVKEIEEELKKYWNSIVHDESNAKDELFVEKNSNDCKQYGFLSVFNHLASLKVKEELINEFNLNSNKNDDKKHSQEQDFLYSWVILPFDFQFNKGKSICKGNGVFRVFLDFDKKNVKKVVINFNIVGKNWNFVVSYFKDVVKDIKFTKIPQDQSQISLLESNLAKMFANVTVKYCNPSELFGFANCSVGIPTVTGVC